MGAELAARICGVRLAWIRGARSQRQPLKPPYTTETNVSTTRLTNRVSAGAFVLAVTLGLGTTSVLPAHSAVVAAAPSATTTTVELKSATVAYGDTSNCLLYTSPSPRDGLLSRMPSSA